MPGEAEIAFGAILARMRRVGHVLVNLREVSIQDRRAVQFHVDGRTFDRYDLVVPLAGRTKITASGGGHTVSRTVCLTRIELAVLGMLGIEHLQLGHARVSGIALAGIANRQSIVATGRQLELELGNKVLVLLLGVENTAMASFALDSAVHHVVVIYRAGPTFQRLAVE